MKSRAFIGALGAGLAMSAPAGATEIAFTTTLTATGSPDFCILGSCALQASNAVNSYDHLDWDAGDSGSFYLGDLSVKPGFGWDSDASIELTLTFTQPDEGTESTGALVKYFHAFGHLVPGVTGGSITWEDTAHAFALGDYDFELDLQNVSGWTIGSPLPLYGTLKLTGVPSDGSQNAGAVPEPANWALMLVGFGAIGGAMRAQRRTAVRFA
jgi:hypothetical protein